MAKYYAYTDGSSRGNPGAGGWGMVVMTGDDSEIISLEYDFEDNVTNNRMELKAMICALNFAESNPQHQFTIISDSTYVVNSINSWMRGWAANGWRNSKKQTVENVDLMKEIWRHVSRPFPNFEVIHCKGHNGEVGNELADALATGTWKKYKELIEFWEIQEPVRAGENWFPID